MPGYEVLPKTDFGATACGSLPSMQTEHSGFCLGAKKSLSTGQRRGAVFGWVLAQSPSREDAEPGKALGNDLRIPMRIPLSSHSFGTRLSLCLLSLCDRNSTSLFHPGFRHVCPNPQPDVSPRVFKFPGSLVPKPKF